MKEENQTAGLITALEKTINPVEDTQLALIGDNKPVLPVPMATNEREGINGTMAINADPEVLRVTIKVAVLKAYINNTKTSSVAELSFLINELQIEVLRSFGSIRLGEIGLAIHKTAMGEFGQVYNLSLSFFVSGIRSYIGSEKRAGELKLMLAAPDIKQLPKQIITAEDLAKNKKQIVLNAFEFYKNKGFFNDYGNYVFNSLADYGVINFTEEDKVKFFKQAKANVINNLTRPSNSIDRRNENRKLLAEIKDNDDHYLIWIEDMKIALLQFFKDLVEFDTDLSELIEA